MSNHNLFYCPEAAQHMGSPPFEICLPEGEAHHAAKVMRLRTGDRLKLLDGEGCFYEAELVEVGRRVVRVRVNKREVSTVEPVGSVLLLVGLLKGKKADGVVQRAVELGVSEIRFFQADHSVARCREEASPERWESVVIAASKQCGRAHLMPVTTCASLDEALAGLPKGGRRWVFWEETGAGSAGVDVGAVTSGGIGLIGPEGGFTKAEIERVRQENFRERTLGRRILRAETAALAAAVLLLHECGEI